MPAVKLLTDESIEKLKSLRIQGFPIRAIARITGVPRATVHHYVRDVNTNNRALVLSDEATDVHHLGIHLPYNVICPDCELEQPHIALCLDCGVFWMGECGHGGEVVDGRHRGVDLGALERRSADGHLHVFILETSEEEN